MTAKSPAHFDSMLQKTNEWLRDLMRELGTNDRHTAYHALRAVLHALRDRLTVDEAADLGAQLPTLIRGIYYEAWKPAAVPVHERKKEQFLAGVSESYRQDAFVDVEEIVRAVFRVLAARVSAGEIDDVRRSLPDELRELWND
jgi:uncharacterized protein (DUF2267 family)